MPLIVVAPDVSAANARCVAPVSLLDVFPTLIELCDLEFEGDLDGQSLVPWLARPDTPRSRPAVTIEERKHVAVRDARYRYIRYADGSEELYDHETDPRELRNIAGLDRVAEIKSRLGAWVPQQWAESAPRKNAYGFDPKSYSWLRKVDATIVEGDPNRIMTDPVFR